jgi:hypothetical protein
MEDVIAHAQWLRARASGPVLLVVDDVDRCRAGFVVELLEAVQTLLRADDERAQPLITIVCADERWLHVAFEEAYQEFTPRLSRPGRTLGHLFLAKLFQLQVRVPALAPSDAVRFGRVKLGLPRRAGPTAGGSSPLPTDVAIHRIEATDSLNDKIRILDELSSSADDRDDAGEVRRAAVALGRTARSEETQRLLRHELEPFLELVESTPRAVVRFLNAYAIQRLASSTGQNQRPSSEELARWTILELRWPAVARRLIDDPELLDAWNRDGPAEDDDHAAALTSEPFRRVVVGGESTRPALDSAALRRCLCLPPRPPDVIDLSTPSPSPVGRHI